MKSRVLLSFALGLVITSFSFAGGDVPFSVTAPGGAIPAIDLDQDNEGISTFPLVMNNPFFDISTVELVLTGLTHTQPEDLDIYLISPSGQTLEVMTDRGDASPLVGANLIFSDNGIALPPEGSPFPSPPNPSGYLPEGPGGFSGSFAGESAGTDSWILLIIDDSASDSGSLVSWTLQGTGVPEPVTLSLLALGALTFVRRRRA